MKKKTETKKEAQEQALIAKINPETNKVVGDGWYCWSGREGGKTFVFQMTGCKMYVIREKEDGSISLWMFPDDSLVKEIYSSDWSPRLQVPSIDDLARILCAMAPMCSLDYYIDELLCPDGSTGENVRQMFKRASGRLGQQKFILCVKKMDYKDFIRTPYWKFVSEIVKKERGRCQLCGSTKDLEAHHLTYEHHGDELHHLEDLTVLCHDCHAKFHDKK